MTYGDVTARKYLSLVLFSGKRKTLTNRKYYFTQKSLTFYRAMHVLLARYCYRKSSVRLSVCLPVTLWYREHIGWASSKLLTRIIAIGSRH